MNPSLIIDTDIGSDVDDALALAFLLQAKIPMAGIITSNGPTKIRAYAATTLLTASGQWTTPVAHGLRNAWTKGKIPFTTGFEECDIHPSLAIWRKETFARMLNTSGNPSTLVSIAPPTSAAWLLSRHIKLPITNVVLMGGVLLNKSQLTSEHNFSADPDAVRFILNQSKPVSVIPLNQTVLHPVPKRIVRLWNSQKRTSAGRLLMNWTAQWLTFSREFTGKDEIFRNRIFLHDPFTVLAAANPSLFHWESKKIRVTNEGLILPDSLGNEVNLCIGIKREAVRIIISGLTTAICGTQQ